MKNLGIRAKIRSAILVLGAGYVVLLVLVQWIASETAAHMSISSGSLFPAALSSQEAETGFQKLTKRYSDAVHQKDKSALALADDSSQAVLTSLQAVEKHTAFDPERQNDVRQIEDRMRDLISRSKSAYEAVIDSKDNLSPQTQAAVAAVARDDKAMESSLVEMERSLSSDFQEQLNSVTDLSHTERVSGFVTFLIAGICATTLAIMVERQVSLPLQNLTTRLKDIAEGEGDLTRRLDVANHDELGEVCECFNQFMEKLHNVIRRVAENTAQLAGASEEIAATATHSAESAQVQAEQTQQIASAMQEMAVTLNDVSDNSQKAATAANQAAATAREGGTTVEQSLSTMRMIAESTKNVAGRVGELGKGSEQIGKITAVIDDIADQTNLLALNATIEAARAGEQGRGFAVVADEVRKLAERTTKATKEIAAMVQSIQNETRLAVQAMEVSNREVASGIERTSQSGKALEQIIEMADHVGSMTSQIATAASRQSGTMTAVNANVSQISGLTQESSDAAQQTAKACADLSNLASDLQRLVQLFKIDEEGQASGKHAQHGYTSSLAAHG